jgi:hypothetical protein
MGLILRQTLRNSSAPRATLLALATTFATIGTPLARAQTTPLHIYSVQDSANQPLDPNGFLLNPHWFGSPNTESPDIEAVCRFRTKTGHLDRRTLVTTRPDCLSVEERELLSLDEAGPALGLGSVCATAAKTGNIRGHVNWFPITTSGQLVWNSFSSGVQDHDLNIDIFPPAPNLANEANVSTRDFGGHRPYHMEFDYDETLGPVTAGNRTFWQLLRAYHETPRVAHRLVDGRLAIVTGLFGVDGVHNFHSELHPVYALSILLDTTGLANGRIQEEWAVLMRNSGGEGDCGEGIHRLVSEPSTGGNQDFIIDLGELIGRSPPKVSIAPVQGTDERISPSASLATSRDSTTHLYINLKHPRPSSGDNTFTYFGTVFIEWDAESAPVWSRRFSAWLPQYQRLPLKLTPVRSRDERLPMLRDVTLDTTVVNPKVAVRVYRDSPWPITTSVKTMDCQAVDRNNPTCLHPWRWVAGLTNWRKDVWPFIGGYAYPHSKYKNGEDFLSSALNILLTLGYRMELRHDQFVPVHQRGDTILLAPHPRPGFSFRFEPFLSPNTVHLGDRFSFAPYTIANLGVSWLPAQSKVNYPSTLGWTTGWGLGVLTRVGSTDLFLETQNAVRQGAYQTHWVFSAGWLAPFGAHR